MTTISENGVFVATKTAHVSIAGERTVIRKGVTRVRAGHSLLLTYPSMFKPVDEGVRFDVETAVDRPPSGRRAGNGQAAAVVQGYDSMKLKDLKLEVENRNKSRDPEQQIQVDGRATISLLAAMLVADDQVQAEAEIPTVPTAPEDKTPEQSDQVSEVGTSKTDTGSDQASEAGRNKSGTGSDAASVPGLPAADSLVDPKTGETD